MEENAQPGQHVTTFTTHTHTHQMLMVFLLQRDAPCVACYTAVPLIPPRQGQPIMFYKSAANKLLKAAAGPLQQLEDIRTAGFQPASCK